MRLRHKPNATDKLARYPQIVTADPESHKGQWAKGFAGNPLHVEIGTGKGRFITQMAAENPSAVFVGLELAESVLVSALDRVLEEDVANVKLLNRNARDVPLLFAEDEVTRLYLNFSDPWPKNRHEKRRLTHQGFLQMYKKMLKPDGEIHLKTDNRNFFKYSLRSFQAFGARVKNVSRNLHASANDGMVMSEYERKFAFQGHPIYRCEVQF